MALLYLISMEFNNILIESTAKPYELFRPLWLSGFYPKTKYVTFLPKAFMDMWIGEDELTLNTNRRKINFKLSI